MDDPDRLLAEATQRQGLDANGVTDVAVLARAAAFLRRGAAARTRDAAYQAIKLAASVKGAPLVEADVLAELELSGQSVAAAA